VACFGWNDFGQTSVPAEFARGAEIIATGSSHTCMSKKGKAACFGINHNGQTIVPFDFISGAKIIDAGL